VAKAKSGIVGEGGIIITVISVLSLITVIPVLSLIAVISALSFFLIFRGRGNCRDGLGDFEF
jgi:small-conductance mechanosensitive channel